MPEFRRLIKFFFLTSVLTSSINPAIGNVTSYFLIIIIIIIIIVVLMVRKYCLSVSFLL